MGTIASSIAQVTTSAAGLSAPTIINHTTDASPDTESSIALPAGTRSVCLQNSDQGLIKFAFTMGNSGTVFFTLFPGIPYMVEGISASASVTIYVQSPKTSQKLQLITWS